MQLEVRDGIQCVELFWGDLSAEAQEKLLVLLGNNGNYDVFPIATININVGDD
jgi:hypothetical protein